MQLHPDKEVFHLKSSQLFWSAKNALHKMIRYCFIACIYAVMPNWCNLLTNLLLNYIINALVIQVGLRVNVHATSTVHACALSLSFSLCSAPHCARARPLISRDDRWPWWPQASWYCQMLRARLNSPA